MTTQSPSPPANQSTAACPALSPVIPEEIRAFLGKPPLTRLEDPAAYEELLARIAQAVMPKDAIEWLLVQDITNLTWESRRLRQAKADLIRLSSQDALANVLTACEPPPENAILIYKIQSGKQRMAQAWMSGDQHARDEVDKVLEAHGLEYGAIEARAAQAVLQTLERFDRLIAIADTRRDTILRDLERRRTAAGERQRTVTDVRIEVDAAP